MEKKLFKGIFFTVCMLFTNSAVLAMVSDLASDAVQSALQKKLAELRKSMISLKEALGKFCGEDETYDDIGGYSSSSYPSKIKTGLAGLRAALAKIIKTQKAELERCAAITKLQLTPGYSYVYREDNSSSQVDGSEIERLHKYPNLKELILSNYSGNVYSILDITNNPKLKVLQIYSCPDFKDIKGLVNCTALEAISCTMAQNLSDLDVSKCSSLKKLKIAGSLKALDVSNNALLTSLSTRLDQLTLPPECPELATVTGLEKCTALTNLDLAGTKITQLTLECPQLIELNLSKCEGLPSVDVNRCAKLKFLKLDGCKVLNSIIGLEKCTNLQTLTAQNTALVKVDVTENSDLHSLDFSNCSQLTDIRGLGAESVIRTDNCPNFKKKEFNRKYYTQST